MKYQTRGGPSAPAEHRVNTASAVEGSQSGITAATATASGLMQSRVMEGRV